MVPHKLQPELIISEPLSSLFGARVGAGSVLFTKNILRVVELQLVTFLLAAEKKGAYKPFI